jgi:hypothetical protein
MTEPVYKLEYEGEGFTATAEVGPEVPDSVVWTGTYSYDTPAGTDGPYSLGRGTEHEVKARFAALARDREAYGE